MIIELIIGGVPIAAWLALFGACLLLTRPHEPHPAAPTQEFGGSEPPAVVSLLVNRWEVTEDAAESTLLDLAARRVIEFRQPGNDPTQTTIHVHDAEPTGLTAYERRVLDRVKGLASGGVVPLTALTFRDPAQAKGWAKRLNAEVVADARARGLSRRRISPRVLSMLALCAAGAAAGVFVAMLHYSHRTHPHDDPTFAAAGATFIALTLLAGTARGERDTPAGREAASRWLGLRAYLRGDEAFAHLPPAAVTVWDRYLSYGDALGATRVCSAVIDLGMGDRKRVWSSFGGTWHRVRVRYPRIGSRYGSKAGPLILWAVVAIAAGYGVMRLRPDVVDALSGSTRFWTALGTALLGVGLLVRGGYRLVRTIVDLASPLTVTGEALWIEVWKATGGGKDRPPTPWLYYLAVDDGSTERTTAWGLPADLYGRCGVGDVVRLTARRWSRRIVDLSVVEKGRAGRLAEVAPAGDDETLIAAAMGLPVAAAPVDRAAALAAALRAPAVAAGQLLTAEEVGRAIGAAVSVRDAAGMNAGPLSVQSFNTGEGPAVQLTLARGLPGKLAMRRSTGGTPLSGLGDEAYAGDGWAMGRRGDTVVMVGVHGAAAACDPRPLLAMALQRLP
ncbi:DUF2207 family protein [Planosporangium sp. 12N6]|uniref:DUF2207 family protein n=1 Tax=Planosporangium spinosum TaxID=3402278 RepID=UPI003CF89A08